MNGMILGAYEQAWRRSSLQHRFDEFPDGIAPAGADSSSPARWGAGALIGFAAMAIALFFAGASYA